jgi:pyruvate,water dikinase
VVTGKDAADFRDQYCAVSKDAKEFTGTPVSPGVGKGRVKIVMNPDECGKVEKGDVIVTVQAVPSFSSAIIKCSALVCDGGTGITSHPATLAREAGVPCVIQTRFARQVLKDGDMVEVDGYKGIVRKI